MRVLIIGGTGVLSTDVLLECLNKGYDVFALNRGRSNNKLPKEVNVIITDINRLNESFNEIKQHQYDAVIDFLSINKKQLEKTFTLLSSLCKQYIFISSACVFRRASNDGIIQEDSPKPNSNLAYSIEKYECEQWLKSNSQSFSCAYTIVRPYITYGDTRIPVGVAPLAKYHWTIIGRMLANKPFFLWDKGENRCTLMHTRDFAYNFVQLIGNIKAYNEDFNIVGDEVYTWKEVVEIIYELISKQPLIVEVPMHKLCYLLPEYSEFIKGDRCLDAIFDNSKLKSVISNYKQNISLRSGILQTIDYYKNNNYLCGIDYKYDGLIDRMIAKSQVLGDNKDLSFKDYLGTATIKDRIIYYIARYLSNRTRTYILSMKNLLRIK